MNAKKRALGKGLSALLDDSAVEPQPVYNPEKELLPVGAIGMDPLDMIEVNPFQPRTDFDEETLNDLAASIKEQGVIQPITLRKLEDNKLQLISGERRLKASRMAGLTEVPAYIVKADDSTLLEMAIVENIQREDLNPIEIAMGYRRLIDEYQLTQEMLSEKIGKNRSSIANHLRLLKLPGEIQIGLRQELITTGHAKALLSLDNPKTQLEVFQDILAQHLSVRETEEIIRELQHPEDNTGNNSNKKTRQQPETPDPVTYQELKNDLEGIYQAKVVLKGKPNGKGSIVINYSGEEELRRITDLLKR